MTCLRSIKTQIADFVDEANWLVIPPIVGTLH